MVVVVIQMKMMMTMIKDEYFLETFCNISNKSKLRNKKTGRINKVHFGDNSMGNFKDSTGLNAYPRLIHGDTKRRKAFRARMKGFLKPGFYSPSYFSYYFLW